MVSPRSLRRRRGVCVQWPRMCSFCQKVTTNVHPLNSCLITSAKKSPFNPLQLLQELKIFPGKCGSLPDHRWRPKAKETEPLGSWLERLKLSGTFQSSDHQSSGTLLCSDFNKMNFRRWRVISNSLRATRKGLEQGEGKAVPRWPDGTA